MQKFIDKMTGYKATNADLTCNGFQFEIGKWYEHKGDIELCAKGFHFCVHPSGPYAYYTHKNVRMFKVEAEQVLDLPVEPGADFKLVAKRIRLVEEITPGGEQNTGNRNTGDWNTGSGNTGSGNTGDWNTGDWNTGSGNTGDGNTGNWNTGNRNTGDWNTGDWNTGNRNTGDGNTGDWNTGNGNTGDWNTTNRCSGFFCQEEPKVLSFDVQTDLTHDEFLVKYPEAYDLGGALHEKDEINFERFKNIPGITPEKLKSLHKKHLAAKKEKA